MYWFREKSLGLTKHLFGPMLLFVRKFCFIPPISFASLFIVLNNYFFFILATVQADTIIFEKIFISHNKFSFPSYYLLS